MTGERIASIFFKLSFLLGMGLLASALVWLGLKARGLA